MVLTDRSAAYRQTDTHTSEKTGHLQHTLAGENKYVNCMGHKGWELFAQSVRLASEQWVVSFRFVRRCRATAASSSSFICTYGTWQQHGTWEFVTRPLNSAHSFRQGRSRSVKQSGCNWSEVAIASFRTIPKRRPASYGPVDASLSAAAAAAAGCCSIKHPISSISSDFSSVLGLSAVQTDC